jgi:hypothetical protein
MAVIVALNGAGEGWVFGLGRMGPLVGLPPGAKVRIRQRPDDFAVAFVRTATDVTQWAIGTNKAGEYFLRAQLARNAKVQG